MKRFFLLTLLCLASCFEPAREASEMPSPYTPSAAIRPATVSLPNPGDPVASAVADQAWKDVADWSTTLYRGFTNFAALPNLAGVQDGGWVRVVGFSGGWYHRITAGTGLSADGQYIVDSAVESGQWVSERWLEVKAKMHPSIGPVPGETTTIATPAGRINTQFIPFGHLSEQAIPLQFFTTSSTVPLTNANGAVLATWDMGTLAATDYVYAHINAVCYSGSANGFEVGVYISNDNGATWNLMTPYNGVTPGVPLVMDSTGTGAAMSVDLSFVLKVSAGHNLVQLRAASISAGTTRVSVGASMIQVRRQ